MIGLRGGGFGKVVWEPEIEAEEFSLWSVNTRGPLKAFKEGI